MERKTYYMILGVSSTESPSGIRTAYLDLARKLHPDVAGEEGTRAFQDVSQAYQVLSDPQRRREYNDSLRRAEQDEGLVVPVRRGRAAPTMSEPVSILGSREGVRPSFEAMFDRFLRNFTGLGVPKSERAEALNVEVLLSREEARWGCVVPVGVPAFHRCPECRGSGRRWALRCPVCEGHGVLEAEEQVRVRIPSLLSSRAIFEVPLDRLGVHNFHLRLHVFVEG